MTGAVWVRGSCLVCGRLFSMHPHLVPSVKVCDRCRRPLDQHAGQGHAVAGPHREPICRACMAWINARRAEIGQPLVTIHARAYEPADLEEL